MAVLTCFLLYDIPCFFPLYSVLLGRSAIREHINQAEDEIVLTHSHSVSHNVCRLAVVSSVVSSIVQRSAQNRDLNVRILHSDIEK